MLPSHCCRGLAVRLRLRPRGLRSNSSKVPFRIPPPIERAPTDILQALASTVRDDHTAPHYSFIDDPFLIPTSKLQKKRYLLAKEYGRRTALKLVEEWPTLFMFDRDQPRLNAFRPQKPLEPDLVEPTEENLIKIINEKEITNAIAMYKRMCKQGISVSKEVKMDLFRLLCYFNSQDLPLSEREDWFAARLYTFSSPESWITKDNLAEKLFDELEKTAEVYSCLICGLCKFPNEYSINKAKKLYQEMVDQNLVPFEEVFNHFILAQISVNDNEFATSHLAEMLRFGIRPSIRTYNSIFLALSQIKMPEESKWELVTKFLSDMAVREEEPSLTVYWTVLSLTPSMVPGANTRKMGPGAETRKKLQMQVSLLEEILERIEQKLEDGRGITSTDSADSIFFDTAMDIAVRAQNEKQVDRLEAIYRHRHNGVKYLDPELEIDFYNLFMDSKLQILPLNLFLTVYKQFVPNILPLNPTLVYTITDELSRRLNLEYSWPLLKRYSEDFISSHMILLDKICYNFLRLFTVFLQLDVLSLQERKEYLELGNRIVKLVEQSEEMKDLKKSNTLKRQQEKNDAQKNTAEAD